MSGIPVYNQSTVAAKAPAPTSTAPPAEDAQQVAPPSTTASPVSTSTYSQSPSAQPGAAPVPAPTASSQRYTPVGQPAPTANPAGYGPPAPQPGAFPSAPPKAGEAHLLAQRTNGPAAQNSMPRPYPAQMSVPPPTPVYGHRSTTSTATAASAAYPVQLPGADYGARRQSLDHPPGYQQDVHASEVSNNQLRARETGHERTIFGNYDNGNDSDSESMWDTAMRMAATAGRKISIAENEVWRRINKD